MGFLSCIYHVINWRNWTKKAFQLSRFSRDSAGFWYAVLVSRIESICPGF